MNNSFNCSNCKYWSQLAQGQGQCRKNPPQAQMLPMPSPLSRDVKLQPVSFWPITTSSQWCGEHSVDLGS